MKETVHFHLETINIIPTEIYQSIAANIRKCRDILQLLFEEALERRKGYSLKVNFLVKKSKQFDYGVHLLQLRILLLFVIFYVCNDDLNGSCCYGFMHNFVLLLKIRKYNFFPPYSLP